MTPSQICLADRLTMSLALVSEEPLARETLTLVSNLYQMCESCVRYVGIQVLAVPKQRLLNCYQVLCLVCAVC